MKTVYKNYNDEEMVTRDRIAASITRYIDSVSGFETHLAENSMED